MHPHVVSLFAENNRPAYRLLSHNVTVPCDCEGKPVKRFDLRRQIANALQYPAGQVTKTMLWRAAKDSSIRCLTIVPADRQTDLLELAARLDPEAPPHLEMMPAEEAQALLGHPAYGMTPLLPGRIPVYMDESLMQHPVVLVGSGVVGEEIELDPKVLATLTSATVFGLAKKPY